MCGMVMFCGCCDVTLLDRMAVRWMAVKDLVWALEEVACGG